jgi:hypothetical protein
MAPYNDRIEVLKYNWEVFFIKIGMNGKPAARRKTYSCKVKEYGVISACQTAIDKMVDKVDGLEASYFRVVKVVNLSLEKG